MFDEQLAVADAIERVQRWLAQPTATFLIPGTRYLDIAFRLLDQLGTASNLTTESVRCPRHRARRRGALERCRFRPVRRPALGGPARQPAQLPTAEFGLATVGPHGPVLRAHAFAQPGGSPRVPGPLIRGIVGAPVEVTVRNLLDDTLRVRGLRDRGQVRPAGSGGLSSVLADGVAPFIGDSLVIPPGATATVRFTPTAPGSF